jgi:hypothetical protein
MAIVEPDRFILALQKNAALYQMLLRNVDQAQATRNRDGGDGWTVLEVICHLRDWEGIFVERAHLIVEHDNSTFPGYDSLAMVIDHNYIGQQFSAMFSDWLVRRGKFLSWLNQCSESDWSRTGIHPAHGQITLLDQIIQTATHDIDHLEQILRVLNG